MHCRLAYLLATALVAPVAVVRAEDEPSVIKQPPTALLIATVSKLKSAPKHKYEFTQALLGEAIRHVAADAGIVLRSLPESSPEYSRLITCSREDSPFQVLSAICRSQALPLLLDGTTWYVRPANDKQQVTCDYEALRDRPAPLGKDEFGPPVIISGLASRHDEIATDLRSILDLPPANTSGNDPDAACAPQVSWKPNSDVLHVVATRLQQLWVQAYLTTYKKGWKRASEGGQDLSANSH